MPFAIKSSAILVWLRGQWPAALGQATKLRFARTLQSGSPFTGTGMLALQKIREYGASLEEFKAPANRSSAAQSDSA